MTEHFTSASEYLQQADKIMAQRAVFRDTAEGERSMEDAVNAFNILTGHKLSETDGWKFMKILKMARAKNGKYNEDDYSDGVAYSALEAESASKENAHSQAQFQKRKEEFPTLNHSFPFDSKLKD